MTEIEKVVAKLADALTSRIAPSEIELWTIREIAAYLRRSEKVTSDKIVTLVGFPQAIRLPTKSGSKGNPLWKAMEVIAWVEKHQEKRAA